jgi:hypothetical protein
MVRRTLSYVTHFIFNNFFLAIVPHLQDNVEKYGRARQSTDDNKTQHRKGNICVPDNYGKNMNTHSEYLIVTAFPWQHWLCECAPTLHYTYVACLILLCCAVITTQLVETNNTINCSGTHQIM